MPVQSIQYPGTETEGFTVACTAPRSFDTESKHYWNIGGGESKHYWRWSMVSKQFKLSKGLHQLHISNREDGTKMRELRIASIDPASSVVFVPTGSSPLACAGVQWGTTKPGYYLGS